MPIKQLPSRPEVDLNTIYCSVEVSRSSWIVGIHCPLTDTNIGIHKLPPGDGKELIDLVRKSQGRVGSGVPVILCYEISYEGFWLVRYLERKAPDIEVVVLDPASLQVDRRFKKVKTDRLDAERMIRALKAQWHFLKQNSWKLPSISFLILINTAYSLLHIDINLEVYGVSTLKRMPLPESLACR